MAVSPPAGAFLAGRAAVVTGGGRGIGAAVARALAAAGAAVVVAARSRDPIERVAERITAAGGRAWAVTADVADEASVRALGEEARARLGAVDTLVHAAGEGGSAPLVRLSLEDWNRMLAVHATGAFLCTREFLPGMIERGFGRIVHIASVAGLQGARYVAHYAAAKHAVVGLVRSAALEVERTGVTVNALCPGYVDTPMTERTLARVQERAGLSREEALAAVLATTGQERLASPDEVAARVAALCRDDAGDVNGQALRMDAGAPAAGRA